MSAAQPDDFSDALSVARRVVAEASELVRGAQSDIGAIRSKSNDRDLVTEWDTRVEELIRARLQELSPGVPILAEESGTTNARESEFWWLVDPIDGTVNFAHGLPLFGITVALERAGQPVAGVVAAPALGWEFYASRGDGAFCGDERLQVSEVATLEQAALVTGFPYDRATTSHNFAEWEHFQRVAGACRRFGAASLDLCMVARGWLDGYWESRLNPWDLSAGALIVEEAGGKVTGLLGGEFRSACGEAVASNNRIHERILEELATVQSRHS